MIHYLYIVLRFCYYSLVHLDLHSFPTRRSSDLDDQHDQDHDQRQSGGDLGDRNRLAIVEETELVLVQGVQDELGADEQQDRGQSQREVDQPLEQAVDQEVQLARSEEHTSELQSRGQLVCRLLLAKKQSHPLT